MGKKDVQAINATRVVEKKRVGCVKPEPFIFARVSQRGARSLFTPESRVWPRGVAEVLTETCTEDRAAPRQGEQHLQ